MKNLILLDNFYSPAELKTRISEWVEHYNNQHYHEAIDNVTPSDCFFGRDKEILEHRLRTKTETMNLSRRLYHFYTIKDLAEDFG
jgi:hypothetical protein